MKKEKYITKANSQEETKTIWPVCKYDNMVLKVYLWLLYIWREYQISTPRNVPSTMVCNNETLIGHNICLRTLFIWRISEKKLEFRLSKRTRDEWSCNGVRKKNKV